VGAKKLFCPTKILVLFTLVLALFCGSTRRVNVIPGKGYVIKSSFANLGVGSVKDKDHWPSYLVHLRCSVPTPWPFFEGAEDEEVSAQGQDV